MLKTILRKRAHVLALILVLSVALTATTAFAATGRIKARRGGKIRIDRGIWFRVPPRSLEEDTVISINMEKTNDSISFECGPDGTTFNRPAQLFITWKAAADLGLSDLTLYGEDGKEIEPRIGRSGLNYGLKSFSVYHFSLYYYRRR